MREEIANSVSHGAGALASLVALILLVVYAGLYGNARHIVSASIFGGSLLLLYLTSTLYHSIQNASAKRILRIFDHSFVFILIAGSYTPFTLVCLQGGWGWTLLGLVWGLAVAGVLLKFACFEKFYSISIALYLAMGWLGVIAIKPLIEHVPAGGIAWLAAGGLLYSLGIIFYKQERLPFAHAIWHLFVIGGSAAHFIAVLRYVVPPIRS